MNKKLIFGIAVLVFVLIFSIFFIFSEKNCGDETFENQCSLTKPYFCEKGKLIEKASICGCPDFFEAQVDLCYSKYQINPKKIFLKYILNGKEDEIEFSVYEGVVNYISNVSKSINYFGGDAPSRLDFKLKHLEEPVQREFLLPLVVEIQNLGLNKKDQTRVAISLVQNIPYNETEDKSIGIRWDFDVNRSRYPYEVLYDMQGVCEGKSELLSFLLKEIGYGVGIFYYSEEDHEAVGIKCSLEYSLDKTGYCFVETTGPAIISDDKNYYLDWGKLNSTPELLIISDGNVFEKANEFKDAQKKIELSNLIEENGQITRLQKIRFEKIKKRYGLEL